MRMIRRTFVATAVAATAALTAGTAFAQGKEVKIGYALAVNSHYGAAANAWAEGVEKGTNGAYKFKQFPASALGGERELIEGLQLGTVEAAIVSTGALSNFVPDVGVVDIPFLFRDTQHARAVMDGAFGQDLLAQFQTVGSGYKEKVHALFEQMPRFLEEIQNGASVKDIRTAINEETLGVPVIAVGLPTVISTRHLGDGGGEEMFLTTRDIDQRVRELSRLIGYGITLALQPALTLEDVTGLLG